MGRERFAVGLFIAGAALLITGVVFIIKANRMEAAARAVPVPLAPYPTVPETPEAPATPAAPGPDGKPLASPPPPFSNLPNFGSLAPQALPKPVAGEKARARSPSAPAEPATAKQ